MRKLDHNVANGATERYVADGHLQEESRTFIGSHTPASFWLVTHISQQCTRLFLRKL